MDQRVDLMLVLFGIVTVILGVRGFFSGSLKFRNSDFSDRITREYVGPVAKFVSVLFIVSGIVLIVEHEIGFWLLVFSCVSGEILHHVEW